MAEQLRPGAITDKEWAEWNEYQKAGGTLSYQGWIDAGKPAPTVETPTVEVDAITDQYWSILDQAISGNIMTSAEAEEAWQYYQTLTSDRRQLALAQLQVNIEQQTRQKRLQDVEFQDYLKKIEAQEKATAEEARLAKIEKTGRFFGVRPEVAEALTPEVEEKYIAQREARQEKRRRQQLWGAYKLPYGEAFQPVVEELKGTEPYKEWFASNYSSLVAQFELAQPKERLAPGVSLQAGKAGREASWAEYLKEQKPKLYEEWYMKSPYQRGEYPSAYAPKIRTVGF